MINSKARSVRTALSLTMGAVFLLSLPIAAAQADHRNRTSSYSSHNGQTVITKTVITRKVKKIYVYEKPRGRHYRHRNTHMHRHHPVRKHRYYEHSAVYYPKPTHPPHRPARNSNFKIDGELGGRLIGGVLGGAAGTQIGKGRGRTVAIIGGAILGSVLGGEVGKSRW